MDLWTLCDGPVAYRAADWWPKGMSGFPEHSRSANLLRAIGTLIVSFGFLTAPSAYAQQHYRLTGLIDVGACQMVFLIDESTGAQIMVKKGMRVGDLELVEMNPILGWVLLRKGASQFRVKLQSSDGGHNSAARPVLVKNGGIKGEYTQASNENHTLPKRTKAPLRSALSSPNTGTESDASAGASSGTDQTVLSRYGSPPLRQGMPGSDDSAVDQELPDSGPSRGPAPEVPAVPLDRVESSDLGLDEDELGKMRYLQNRYGQEDAQRYAQKVMRGRIH